MTGVWVGLSIGLVVAAFFVGWGWRGRRDSARIARLEGDLEHAQDVARAYKRRADVLARGGLSDGDLDRELRDVLGADGGAGTGMSPVHD